MPHRERYLFVCTNRREAGHPKGSCAAEGSEALLPLLKAEVAKRGLAKKIRVCGSTCLDLCEIAASMVQEPEHVAYGGVKEADIPELVSALEVGTVLQRLVVHGVLQK